MPAVSGQNIRGPQGAQGPAGADGQDGAQGPRGEQGPAGADGAQGERGPQGPAGADGKDGAAATISVGTVTTGAPGSSASVVNAGTSNAAVLNFTIPRGATGEQGPKGDPGQAGADGAQGPAGENGGYYTPAVSDTGDLTWTASKAGMPSVAGANIKGQKGDKGDPGDPGAQGPAGADGAPGAAATINGVNALTLNATGGLSGSQSGSTYTLDGSTFVQKTANLSGTDYTTIRARGIQLVSSAPGTLPNGCIAIVYS